MEVQLLIAPDCPRAESARRLLAECVEQLAVDVSVRERVGEYPSPTILVDGVDVMTGAAGVSHIEACRLDVPTRSRLLAALSGEA